MMKVLVLYKSIAGHTKRYAQMIGEQLSADCLPVDGFDFSLLENYDVIIFGGNLYAGTLNGYTTFFEHFDCLKNKIVIIYAVGATPNRAGVVEVIKSKNFHGEQEKKLPFFYLRGGFDYKKLPFKERIIMSLLRLMLLFKYNKTSDESMLLASYKSPLDTVKIENLQGLLEYVEGLA